MILKPAIAAMIATGLVAPEKPSLVFPKPAIIKREVLKEAAKELALPMTMGFLPHRRTVLTYRSFASNGTLNTSYTLTSQSFGAAPSSGDTRFVLAVISGCVNSTAGSVSSVTIGGVSATFLYRVPAGNSSGPREIWYIQNNTLTSGVVAVTFSSDNVLCGSAIWTLVNPTSITPVGSWNAEAAASAASVTVTVPQDGVGLAWNAPNLGHTACTWTNATEVYDTTVRTSTNISGASFSTVGSYTVTVTSAAGTSAQRISAVVWI